MDFGVVSHKQTSPNAAGLGSAGPGEENRHGSVNLKHQRSGLAENTWKSSKMPKPGEVDFSSKKAHEIFTAFERSNLWPSSADDGQKMLSFSSSQPHCGGVMGGSGSGSGRSIAFSVCQDENNTRNGGSGGIRGAFTRLKGPFTPSQWMELEHQALIYKHIVANVPVPSNLLAPIKRALYSYGLTGPYASNFLGWGPFHLGYSGSNDPEPGRCRRTDGKKWRCSRDAVPDQKYCERHINRGRHRSRKPVEGHTGHAVSGPTTSSKVAPIASPSSSSSSFMSSANASNTLSAVMHHHFTSLHPDTANASTTDHLVTRSQGFQGLSLIPPTIGLKSKDSSVPIQKQQHPFSELSHSDFGIVSSDSLLNPSERISYMNANNSDSFLRFDAKETNNQQPVHHFIDDWPKDQPDRASGPWPEELKSDWTQLSMSIPMAPDFSSSSSSPAQEKSTLSALRLTHDLDPTGMSLGGGATHDLGESIEKQAPWSPVVWGNSIGGPLGEVLTSTNASALVGPASFSSVKASWKSNHQQQLGSSPTGVLQKSTFGSLSNSSSGSSQRSADNNKAPESVSLCNDLLGSALVSSAAIPSP